MQLGAKMETCNFSGNPGLSVRKLCEQKDQEKQLKKSPSTSAV